MKNKKLFSANVTPNIKHEDLEKIYFSACKIENVIKSIENDKDNTSSDYTRSVFQKVIELAREIYNLLLD